MTNRSQLNGQKKSPKVFEHLEADVSNPTRKSEVST